MHQIAASVIGTKKNGIEKELKVIPFLDYLLKYLLSHFYVVIAMAVVIFVIILGFKWAINYGLRGILIILVAGVLVGCFVLTFLGAVLLTGELSRTLPAFLCSNLQFCPPAETAGGGGQQSGGGQTSGIAPVAGLYDTRSPTSDGCLDIHEGPSPDSPVIGCIPNGTAVRVISTTPANEWNGSSYFCQIEASPANPGGHGHCGGLVYIGS